MSGDSETNAGTLGPLLRLSWPVLAEQTLGMLVAFSDTWLAGRYLEREHLAAMAFISYALWALTSAFAMVTVGATALTARFVGARDYPLASRVANQAFLVGGILALAGTTIGLLIAPTWVSLMQLDGEVARLATRYLWYLILVLPAMMLEAVGIACLRGAGDMVTGLVTMVLVNIVNIAVAWSLLFGLGPLPELGWDALAIGTACGHLVGALIPTALLLRGRAGLRIEWRLLRPDWNLMRRILRIGLPGGVDIWSVIACQMIFLSLVNRLGPLAAAAHGVAIRIEALAYLPGSAFQVAATTLAGQHLGALDHRQALRSVLAACLLAGVTMSTAGMVLYFGADSLAMAFLSEGQQDVARQAAPLLRIISLVMLPFAVLMVLSGALRGAGDTRWPLLFTLIGFLAVRLPLAYLLAHAWGWGIQGAWYAMAADLSVRCLLVTARFARGGWQRIIV